MIRVLIILGALSASALHAQSISIANPFAKEDADRALLTVKFEDGSSLELPTIEPGQILIIQNEKGTFGGYSTKYKVMPIGGTDKEMKDHPKGSKGEPFKDRVIAGFTVKPVIIDRSGSTPKPLATPVTEVPNNFRCGKIEKSSWNKSGNWNLEIAKVTSNDRNFPFAFGLKTANNWNCEEEVNKTKK